MAKPRGPMAKPYYRPPLWSSQKAKMLDLYYRPPPWGLGLGPPGGPWAWDWSRHGARGDPGKIPKFSFPKETFGKFLEIPGKFSGIFLGGPCRSPAPPPMAKPRGPMAKPYYRPPLWSSQKAKMLDLYYRPPPWGLGLAPPPGDFRKTPPPAGGGNRASCIL